MCTRRVALAALVVSSAGGGPAIADTVRFVSLTTNRIAVNPVNGQVYATVPSSAGAPSGNSITAIDPVAGTAGASVFMGSEPTQIAISGSGRYAYVGLAGVGAVRRFDCTTQTAGLQFSLGSGSLSLHYAEDIEVQPGNENVVAISRRNMGFSPRHEGVVVYDDGVLLPAVTPGHTGSNVIAFTDDPAVLLGYNNETTDFRVRRMSVTASGVSINDAVQGLITGFGVDVKHAAGFLYSGNGRKINASTLTLAGTFSASGLIEPDPARGRIYFLDGSGSPRTLRAFDIETFLPAGTMSIPGVASSAGVSDLSRWGDDGLVFRTSAGQVVLVNTSLIPPAPATCYPNCDNSTAAPVLNVQDFGCFLTRYAAGEPYANCDQSATPPVLNVQDFGCFLTKYAAGCP